MSDASARIRLKLHQTEIECEARESFLVSSRLSELLGGLAELLGEHAAAQGGAPSPSGASTEGLTDGRRPQSPTSRITLTTQTLAARLQANSGPKLAMAAIARLVLADGKETFSRTDVLDEMKTAKRIFKQSHGTNLQRTLSAFVEKGRLNESATDTYALTEHEQEVMERQIAQHQ